MPHDYRWCLTPNFRMDRLRSPDVGDGHVRHRRICCQVLSRPCKTRYLTREDAFDTGLRSNPAQVC
jgi:hypothetical protein